MNKVVTINLGGTVWQLEEAGYDALRTYLENATARLQGNPDQEEILSDIEWAIAEKFRALLSSHKTVVLTKEVTAVLAQMGPIEADTGKAADPAAGGSGTAGGASDKSSSGSASGFGTAKEEPRYSGRGTPRRLYRIREGEEIAGVCNGLAAYVGIDVTLIRLAFVFLTIFFGSGVLVYIIMAIVVPEATTPEEKAAASGNPSTAEEFIRRAKEGYYEAIRGFPNRQARREWKRRFKSEMRAHAYQWKYNWHAHWWKHAPMPPMPPMAPMPPGTGFALPFLSLLHGTMKILWLCAVVSLLATGAVFGWVLPASIPVWAGVFLLIALYHMFAWPLKAGRRACYWSLGHSNPAWSLIFVLDAVLWFGLIVILFWIALHHFPELRAAAENLPAQGHQALDDIRNWWHKK